MKANKYRYITYSTVVVLHITMYKYVHKSQKHIENLPSLYYITLIYIYIYLYKHHIYIRQLKS